MACSGPLDDEGATILYSRVRQYYIQGRDNTEDKKAHKYWPLQIHYLETIWRYSTIKSSIIAIIPNLYKRDVQKSTEPVWKPDSVPCFCMSMWCLYFTSTFLPSTILMPFWGDWSRWPWRLKMKDWLAEDEGMVLTEVSSPGMVTEIVAGASASSICNHVPCAGTVRWVSSSRRKEMPASEKDGM